MGQGQQAVSLPTFSLKFPSSKILLGSILCPESRRPWVVALAEAQTQYPHSGSQTPLTSAPDLMPPDI